MEPNEKLLVMTICKLLDRTPSVLEVERAYDWAIQQLEKPNREQKQGRPADEGWR